MSAPPDFMTQLLQGSNGLNGSLYSPTMGLALGLLQAGGPSRMPVSLGQALGQGLQTGQQFQGQGLQNAMQQLQLKQDLMRMQYMQSRFGGGQPQTMGSPVISNNSSVPNIPSAPQGNPQPSSPSPVAPITQAPDFNSALNSNPLFQQGLLDSFMGLPSGAPEMQLAGDAVKNQSRVLTDAEVKQLTGSLPLPGRIYSVNPLGKVDITGSDPYQVMKGFNPTTGAYTTNVVDTRDAVAMKKAEEMQNIGSDPTQPLPPTLEKIVDGAIAGRIDPKSQALKSPIVVARIMAKDPSWSEQDYPAQMKARQAFAPGGVYNKNLVALGTAAQHIDLLTKYVTAMQNSDVPSMNAIRQAWQKQTGSPLPTNFDAIKPTVAAEIAKANGEASLGALEEIQAPLKKSGSPAQLLGAIQGFKGLLAGKAASLRQQFVASKLGSEDDFNQKFFTPEAQTMFGGNAPTIGNVKSLSDAELLRQLGVSGG